MSRSNDGNSGASLRHWSLAACVMAIPLAWVGTQSADQPLYTSIASVHGVHASVATAQAPVDRHAHASMLGSALRSQGTHDVRALLLARGLQAHAKYDTPWLSGSRHHGRLSLGAQEYQLAVTDAR